jgi:hypothetical protein
MKIGLIVLAVLVGFGILAAACLALGANEVAKEIEKDMGKADASDYRLSEGTCTEESGFMTAKGTITNTSDKAQGFEVRYRFMGPDGVQVGRASDFVDTIEKGGTANYSVGLLEDAPEGTTCELVGVNYHIFDDETSS